MDALLSILIFFIMFLPTFLFRAFVLVKGWTWFIVPLGLPHVTIAWMLGIAGMVQLVTIGCVKSALDEEANSDSAYPYTKKIVKLIVKSVVISLIFWAFFAVYHSYM